MRLNVAPMMLAGLSLIVLLPASLAPQTRSAEIPPGLPPPQSMKAVGLIGGTAWYSTVDYYRYINKAVNDAYGNNTNPPLIVYNLDNHRIQQLQDKNQWDEIAAILTDAAMKLQSAGAQAIVLCANTQHKAYGPVAKNVKIPILHIGDATGVAIQRRGLKKIGLVGTRFTMEDGFMISWLKERYAIEVMVPASASARQELHRIIHEELDMGVHKPGSKKYALGQIEELRRRGAQGIVLACTEFPLIIKQSDVSVPVFDTTLLHSQMAVDFILGGQGLARVQPTP